MKQMDAESEIRQIWMIWSGPEDKYDPHFGFKLYIWLENNRPDLLKFKYSGDKYQKINGWVMNWQDEKKKI
ncbi:MAG: hypothetical protein M3R00_07490 [Pseudomonadota bacterium]|nr:hypothetical protein [Pseudomonadota bacterium]